MASFIDVTSPVKVRDQRTDEPKGFPRIDEGKVFEGASRYLGLRDTPGGRGGRL